jgi:hypothetical protein
LRASVTLSIVALMSLLKQERDMTGWNMPPGCNVSDIPGNRPEDQAEEAFYEWVFDVIGGRMSEGDTDKLAEVLFKKMGDAYKQGYDAGKNDTEMAHAYAEEAEAHYDRLPDHGDWAEANASTDKVVR